MKAWDRLTMLVPTLLLLLLVGLNGSLLWLRDEVIPDEALVGISHTAKELEKGRQMNELVSSKIQVKLFELKKTSVQSYMDCSRTRSVLLPAKQEDSFYRFTYCVQRIPSSIFWIINATLLGVILLVVYLLFYIHRQII